MRDIYGNEIKAGSLVGVPPKVPGVQDLDLDEARDRCSNRWAQTAQPRVGLLLQHTLIQLMLTYT